MKLRIIESAKEDLIEGFHFYEEQTPGLGTYFLDALFSDIDSLAIYAGVHAKVYGSHRALSKRFHLPSTMTFPRMRFRFTRCSIADGVHHGFATDLNGSDHALNFGTRERKQT